MYRLQSNTPSHDQSKAQHIDNLFKTVPNIRSKGIHYFEVAIMNGLQLNIRLPPDFPNTPPFTFLSTSVVHPMVVNGTEVNLEKMNGEAWSCSKHQLGDWIFEILRRFRQHPPILSFPSSSSASSSSSATTSSTSSIHSQPTSSSTVKSNMSHLSRDWNLPDTELELSLLAKDSDARKYHVYTSPHVKAMRQAYNDLRLANSSLVNKVLKDKTALLDTLEEIKKIKALIQTLHTQYQTLEQTYEKLSTSHYHPIKWKERIKLNVKELENEAEKLADAGLTTEVEIKKYRHLRKLYHLRSSLLSDITIEDAQ